MDEWAERQELVRSRTNDENSIRTAELINKATLALFYTESGLHCIASLLFLHRLRAI